MFTELLEAASKADKDTYVLDYSLWRCGGSSSNATEGVTGLRINEPTYMLNKNNGMCCLGQFALQRGVREENLKNRTTPTWVARKVGENYDPLFVEPLSADSMEWVSTDLGFLLMDINDDSSTTVKSKLKLIKRELEKHGKTLVVINAPEEAV